MAPLRVDGFARDREQLPHRSGVRERVAKKRLAVSNRRQIVVGGVEHFALDDDPHIVSLAGHRRKQMLEPKIMREQLRVPGQHLAGTEAFQLGRLAAVTPAFV